MSESEMGLAVVVGLMLLIAPCGIAQAGERSERMKTQGFRKTMSERSTPVPAGAGRLLIVGLALAVAWEIVLFTLLL